MFKLFKKKKTNTDKLIDMLFKCKRFKKAKKLRFAASAIRNLSNVGKTAFNIRDTIKNASYIVKKD